MTSKALTEVKGTAEVKWLETSCLGRAQAGVTLSCISQFGWLHVHRTAEGMVLIIPTISQHFLRVQSCFGARDTSVIWIQACMQEHCGEQKAGFHVQTSICMHTHTPWGRNPLMFSGCPSAPLDCRPFQVQDLRFRLWHKTRNKITSLKGICPVFLTLMSFTRFLPL